MRIFQKRRESVSGVSRKDLPDIRSLYYHRDFDGTVSAAMLISISSIPLKLFPVDYSVKQQWASKRLERRAAIVDFLFHPNAVLWIDHHANPFVLPNWKTKATKGRFRIWDNTSPSCPPLIMAALSFPPDLQEHFASYVHWSSIIDAALYESPQQATDLSNPFLLISEILALPSINGLSNLIAQEIAHNEVEAVLSHPIVQPLANSVVGTELRLRDELLPHVQYDGLVAFLDQSFLYSHFQRYYPYLVHPEAAFVVGIYRNQNQNSFTISVGANPWKLESGINMGLLCQKFGGGGRQNVGGIPVADTSEAQIIAGEVVRALHRLADVPQFASDRMLAV